MIFSCFYVSFIALIIPTSFYCFYVVSSLHSMNGTGQSYVLMNGTGQSHVLMCHYETTHSLDCFQVESDLILDLVKILLLEVFQFTCRGLGIICTSYESVNSGRVFCQEVVHSRLVPSRDVTDLKSDFISVGFHCFFTNPNPSDLQARFLSYSGMILVLVRFGLQLN